MKEETQPETTVQRQMGLHELSVKVAKLCPALFMVRRGSFLPEMAYWNIDGEQGEAVNISIDRNACAVFETNLNDWGKNMYVVHLFKEIGFAGQFAGVTSSTVIAFKLTTATAEQRCRAFIATMEASSVPNGTDTSSASS